MKGKDEGGGMLGKVCVNEGVVFRCRVDGGKGW